MRNRENLERGRGHGLAGKGGEAGGKGGGKKGSRGICWQWQHAGKCSRGVDCPFDHPVKDGNSNNLQSPSAPTTPRSKSISRKRGTALVERLISLLAGNTLRVNARKGRSVIFGILQSATFLHKIDARL
eukprot:70168-Karenia_brevis.AAC.1